MINFENWKNGLDIYDVAEMYARAFGNITDKNISIYDPFKLKRQHPHPDNYCESIKNAIEYDDHEIFNKWKTSLTVEDAIFLFRYIGFVGINQCELCPIAKIKRYEQIKNIEPELKEAQSRFERDHILYSRGVLFVESPCKRFTAVSCKRKLQKWFNDSAIINNL